MKIAALALAVLSIACAHPKIYTSELRCPDAHPGADVRVETEALPSAESAGLLVIVRAKDGDTPLEAGSIRVFPRDVAGELHRPRADSVGYYEYRALRPGWYLVEVRKVGYDEAVDSLELRRATRLKMSVWLSPKYSCLI